MTVTIRIDDHAVDYIPVLTNANVEYDYAYTIDLMDSYSSKSSREARLVLIPAKSESYQRGRYASGLFFSEQADSVFYPKKMIIEKLWRRVHTDVQRGE
jgi:hypothetical protein